MFGESLLNGKKMNSCDNRRPYWGKVGMQFYCHSISVCVSESFYAPYQDIKVTHFFSISFKSGHVNLPTVILSP